MIAPTFFARWLARSIRGTLASGAVATASLALAASLVFMLVAVSEGVERKLGAELKAYGANLLALPRLAPLRFGLGAYELGAVEEERTLPASAFAGLPSTVVEAAVPGLLVRARVDGRDAGAVGYDLGALRALNPLWRVSPRWPEREGEILVGVSAAARLGLTAGAEVRIARPPSPSNPHPRAEAPEESSVRGEREAEATSLTMTVAGVIETGGPEDENLLLPLDAAQRLAGRPGEASFALLRGAGSGEALDAVARTLERGVPGVEVRTVRQVARAEAALLGKVRRLLALVTIALGAASAFTVAGTLGVLLLSRRREIGLCLALGAEPGTIRRLLLAEACFSGVAGGLLGCAAGALAAEVVARGVFGAFIGLDPLAVPLALATALAISMGAAAWPVRRAVRVSPCDTLRAP